MKAKEDTNDLLDRKNSIGYKFFDTFIAVSQISFLVLFLICIEYYT